jgi:hypothetical protein
MARQIVWSYEASADIEALANYISRDSIFYAAAFIQETKEDDSVAPPGILTASWILERAAQALLRWNTIVFYDMFRCFSYKTVTALFIAENSARMVFKNPCLQKRMLRIAP